MFSPCISKRQVARRFRRIYANRVPSEGDTLKLIVPRLSRQDNGARNIASVAFRSCCLPLTVACSSLGKARRDYCACAWECAHELHSSVTDRVDQLTTRGGLNTDTLRSIGHDYWSRVTSMTRIPFTVHRGVSQPVDEPKTPDSRPLR